MKNAPKVAMLLTVVSILLVGSETALAGGPIGWGSNISQQSVDAVSPAVAYNPDREEYLVVWYNDRPGNDDIQAQRVSRGGAPTGSAFYIAAGSGADRRFPDVAYNNALQEYLVVWEQFDQSTGDTIIYGARVRSTGGVIGSPFPIFTGSPSMLPAVAYASTEDKYLVVWTWFESPGMHIVGCTVTVSVSGTTVGSPFYVSEDTTGSVPRSQPDLAYNRARNEFLVVWKQDDTPSDPDIYAQRVKMAGGEGLLGSPLEICSLGGYDEDPAVAALPYPSGTGQYLVVWEDRVSSSGNILGQLRSGDGTVEILYLMPSFSSDDQTDPAVAATESGQRYLILWSHSDYYTGWAYTPVVGREVDTEGKNVGEEADIWGVNAQHPAVASGPLGDFFVAYDEQELIATHRDVYGLLWGTRVYLPLVLRNP